MRRLHLVVLVAAATAVAPVSPAHADPASPAPAPAPAPAVTPYANTDPSDDDMVGPPDALDDCDARLAAAGVSFRHASLPVHSEHKLVCGAPQVVVYLRGPGHIAYDPAPLLSCPMALALASFERIVQEEATRDFSVPVVRITQLGTYNCREMAAYPGWVSEHAYANAIDVARFTLR
ncbi:MAG TPA: extensin family protein, partial [Polyangiaceae bacterium]